MLKYFWSGKRVTFWLTLVAVVLVSGVIGHYAKTDFRSYRAQFVIETDSPVLFDIYYDIGRGYNEVDHQSVKVETVDQPVTLDFCIPVWDRLKKLRFDPAREHIRMKIYSITMYYDANTVFKVPLDTLSPKQEIAEHSFDGRQYQFETAVDGEDPIIELTTLGLPPKRSLEYLRYILWMGGGVLVLLLGGYVHRFFFLGR